LGHDRPKPFNKQTFSINMPSLAAAMLLKGLSAQVDSPELHNQEAHPPVAAMTYGSSSRKIGSPAEARTPEDREGSINNVGSSCRTEQHRAVETTGVKPGGISDIMKSFKLDTTGVKPSGPSHAPTYGEPTCGEKKPIDSDAPGLKPWVERNSVALNTEDKEVDSTVGRPQDSLRSTTLGVRRDESPRDRTQGSDLRTSTPQDPATGGPLLRVSSDQASSKKISSLSLKDCESVAVSDGQS
jgi:hypothetical protein